jgi:hypothetical protein
VPLSMAGISFAWKSISTSVEVSLFRSSIL